MKKSTGQHNLAAFMSLRMKNKVDSEACRLGLNISKYPRCIIDKYIPDGPPSQEAPR